MSQNSGLICREMLPVHWVAVDSEQWQLQFDSLSQVNEERFRVIGSLDEHRADISDEHPGIAQEIHRLDFKLNLVMEMLAHLIAPEGVAHGEVPVILEADSIRWQPGPEKLAQFETACWGQLDVYLQRSYPFPIVFGGETGLLPDDPSWVRMRLAVMPELVQEAYEKFLFRCHRRQIARERQQLKNRR